MQIYAFLQTYSDTTEISCIFAAVILPPDTLLFWIKGWGVVEIGHADIFALYNLPQ